MISEGSDSDDFEIVDHQEASLSLEEIAKAQTWLQPTEYTADSSEFHRHLASQAPGTGLWICDTPRFQQWHDSEDHGSLWIKGVPGAGKSVTAASLIRHLERTEHVPILFFFFRYIIAANRRPRALVRDWLAQLLPHSVRLQATLQPLLSGDLEDVSDEQLWEQLLTGLTSLDKAYCVVDAMDEMELTENDDFLQRLNGLATYRPGSIKLLMTSRPKQYLQSSLRDASIVHISLEHDLVGKDIAVFVSYRLKSILSEPTERELRDSLESTICTRSRGLFLYARLLLDQIAASLQATPQLDLRALASNLPIGLEEMYNSMLLQQAESMNIQSAVQVFLLGMVTHASRALRLNELANALDFALSSSRFASPKPKETPKTIARSACAPLLEILEDETVQIIHHSFTEFLLDADRGNAAAPGSKTQFPVLNNEATHRSMVYTCLEFLQSGALRPTVDDTDNEATDNDDDIYTGCSTCVNQGICDCSHMRKDPPHYLGARLRHPFLEYAVKDWSYHANRYDVEDEIFFRSVTNFVNSENIDFQTWLDLEWDNAWPTMSTQIERIPSPLHIAAFAGLTKYATALLRNNQSVHSLDRHGRTPLFWACRKGQTGIVSLLLKHGSDPNAEDARGVKPLHEAARKNFSQIVKMLLEAGVDPHTPKTRENYENRRRLGGEKGTKGETALEYVCVRGHTESIMAMLPHLQPETLAEVLCESCRYGKFEAVRAVLENSNVSPNSKFAGATAIYFACMALSVPCIEILLDRGADVNLMSKWEPIDRRFRRREAKASTPLHALVERWKPVSHPTCHAIFGLLLRAGADINIKNEEGERPLLTTYTTYQPRDGWRRLVNLLPMKALVEAGADLAAVDGNGNSIVDKFLECHKDLELLNFLFDYGAEATSTTLHMALSNLDTRKDLELLNFLFDHGAVATSTALHMALSNLNTAEGDSRPSEVVQFLLNRGASCSDEDARGYCALEIAAQNTNCDLETFKMVLRYCHEPDIRNRCLRAAASRPNQEDAVKFIQELLSAGICIDAQDKDGSAALLALINSERSFTTLRSCGARLDSIDFQGRGALHYLVKCSPTVERLQKLVKEGLDPLKVDNNGNTLLHVTASTFWPKDPNIKLIQQLLEYGISVNTKNSFGRTPLHVFIEDSPEWYPTRERSGMHLLDVLRKYGDHLDVNAQDAEGLTPLHLAAMRSEIDVSRLLDAGADANTLTNDGRSALHLACRARQSNVVGFLLHRTCNSLINGADSYGRTPLHDACTSGRPESVYYLLRSGAEIEAKDSNGRTPLHACAEFATEQHIWFLLGDHNKAAGQFNVDRYRPNAERTSVRWCTLTRDYIPLSNGHDTARIGVIVDLLLGAGANVTATDSDRVTPLELALAYSCKEMISRLQFTLAAVMKQLAMRTGRKDLTFSALVSLEKSNPLRTLIIPETFLQEVCQHPAQYIHLLQPEDIDWIASQNGVVTGANNGYTHASLLHLAAENGFTEILCQLGSAAKTFDDPESVLALIQGSNFINQYLEFVTPTLNVACTRKLANLAALEVLVERCGVDVNSHTLMSSSSHGRGNARAGPTALHILAEGRHWWQLDAIRYLVSKGATIDSRNEYGETPLHIACGDRPTKSAKFHLEDDGYWKLACVQLLLELGADPNAIDNVGLSCAHKAIHSPEKLQKLLERGVNLSCETTAPLFTVLVNRDLQALITLLDLGTDPNSVDSQEIFKIDKVKGRKRYALLCACLAQDQWSSENMMPLIKLLIERGADLYAHLNSQETLIHCVFEHAQDDVISGLLDFADKIDFNARDQLGRTVFLATCNRMAWQRGYNNWYWFQETGPVMRPWGYGADIMAVDNEGRNALHHLLDNTAMDQDTILRFIEQQACKILLHQKDKKGFSPLHCALRFLRPVVCEKLIALGADPLSPDPTSTTALQHILSQCLQPQRPPYHKPEYYEGCLRLWQAFLSLGADINMRDNQSNPPLFLYLSTPESMEYVDKDCSFNRHIKYYNGYFADADVHARNRDGETALHIIAKREKGYYEKYDRDLFELVVGQGLDPLAEDGKGRSSLDVAAALGKTEILDLFKLSRSV